MKYHVIYFLCDSYYIVLITTVVAEGGRSGDQLASRASLAGFDTPVSRHTEYVIKWLFATLNPRYRN